MAHFWNKIEIKFILLATSVILLGALIINTIIYSHEYNEHYELAELRTTLLSRTILNLTLNHLPTTPQWKEQADTVLSTLFRELANIPERTTWGILAYNDNQESFFQIGDSSLVAVTLQNLSSFRIAQDTTITIETTNPDEKISISAIILHNDQDVLGFLALATRYHVSKLGLKILVKKLVTITVITVIFSVFLATLVARKLAAPIKDLAREMERVESPDYNTSLVRNRRDELGILQEQFLQMLQRLKQSEQKEQHARKALIQAEKMTSIGTLASGIAHEINNPLSGLMQSVGRIKADPENVSQTKKYISLIYNSLLHIKQVVHDLLDFSKQRELSVKPINVNEVLLDAVNMLKYQLDKARIKVKTHLSPDLRDILGDVFYLKQVFVNLILNAIDAMSEGGTLTLYSHDEGDHTNIEIVDTGGGIKPKDLAKVFDPFFTTKGEGKGTGLGLSICYSIIQEHHGDITITSEVNAGTKVAITLPHA
jgi:signal transduction histidine kinase